jgi:hypothetical protein
MGLSRSKIAHKATQKNQSHYVYKSLAIVGFFS